MFSRLAVALSSLVLVTRFTSLNALPTRFSARDIDPTEDAILFDAAAFQDPVNPENTIAALQSFVFVRQIDFVLDNIAPAFEALGLEVVGDKVQQVVDRAKLFAAIGKEGQDFEVSVDGCSETISLAETAGSPDTGMVLQNVNLGACDASRTQFEGKAEAILSASGREFTANIFKSAPDGFGVISGAPITDRIMIYRLANGDTSGF
jgi:hypothetical protein